MQGTRMVPLTSVPSEFAGRVLVAKLGSAGIIAELRGVSRVYPVVLGSPEVWVEADGWSEATELITVDVSDEAFAAAPVGAAGPPGARSLRPLIALVALLVLASFVVGMRGCGTTAGGPASSLVR